MTQPTRPFTSAGWTGPGIAQGAPGWCFAAAEYLVQRAYGDPPSQAEIAHNVMIKRGEIGDPVGNAVAYYQACVRFFEQGLVTDITWPNVQPLVRADQGLFNMLRNEYGQPPLTNRTFTRGNVPDPARIRQTINEGGLVLIGSRIHWKIVYGYSADATDTIASYMVYDPLGNGTNHPAMPPDRMMAGIEETYYITG